MTEQLIVTPGATWRQPRTAGYIVQLPSGNVARLRPVALDVLVGNGTIPDLLSPLAAKALWDETSGAQIAADPKLAVDYMALINAIVPAAMLEPLVVDNPTADNEITLVDLDFTDKIFVFNLAIGPVETLRRFREQQTKRLHALQNGDGDGEQAEPAAGD